MRFRLLANLVILNLLIDDRLLKGFEYTAKYNLGEDVPFTETVDRTGKYHHTRISDKGRGRLRAVYEQVYNHYVTTLVLNLNASCVLGDTSWIKPGKVMRDTTLITENSKAIIDFAAEGGQAVWITQAAP